MQYLLSAFVLACFAPSQVLLLPEWVTFSSQGVAHVEQGVYVVVRAEATRQVTEREYTVREASQRLAVSTYNLPPALMPTG